MKLLVRNYVASLKERQELDAILPDLLSELGYNVISRPSRGTTQRGGDVAAIRKDPKGRQRVYRCLHNFGYATWLGQIRKPQQRTKLRKRCLLMSEDRIRENTGIPTTSSPPPSAPPLPSHALSP
jgi:hypothetical protein